MIITSHGPLPTETEVKRQIDFLTRWKNNQYFLSAEASVELKVSAPEPRRALPQCCR